MIRRGSQGAPTCSASIASRMARWMSAVMFVALGSVSVVIYSAMAMRVDAAQQEALHEKQLVFGEFLKAACTLGEEEVLRKLALFEPARVGTHVALWRGDGSVLFRDKMEPFKRSVGADFNVPAPDIAGGFVRAHMDIDVTHDERMMRGLGITLLLTTLGGAALTLVTIRWLVRREMQPLQSLAGQTRAISPQRLDQRLQLECPAEELLPWVQQFNALMDRLELAYKQLEGFNADVAHELRTPLATLIGETELALSRERSTESLRETLASNLEEMQRLSAMVNDMLFLSHADRGAVARRGEPVSLAAVANQVLEFHEATLEDAGLAWRIDGDAHVAVDEPLFKRALSNLVGNACRYAERGSTIVIAFTPDEAEQVRVTVQNQGEAIDEQVLPRLFDRFFRGDQSRCCPEQQHHGLGLAIVAAIARMHAGRTLAESAAGLTRVGFTLAPR